MILPSETFDDVQSSERLARDRSGKPRVKLVPSLRVAVVSQEYHESNRNGKGYWEDQDRLPELWFEDSIEDQREGDELPVE